MLIIVCDRLHEQRENNGHRVMAPSMAWRRHLRVLSDATEAEKAIDLAVDSPSATGTRTRCSPTNCALCPCRRVRSETSEPNARPADLTRDRHSVVLVVAGVVLICVILN